MTGFLTILGAVAGAIFSPALCIILAIFAVVIALLWACFSGSKEAAHQLGFNGWAILASWVAFAIILPLGVTLAIFLMQFEPFAWVLQ